MRCILFATMLLGYAVGFGAEPPAEPDDMPLIIPDPSAGEWLVDRFAGNSTAGPTFLQGPAREAGGLGRCGACPLPDGRVLIPFGGGVAEVDTEGTLRLVAPVNPLNGTTAQVTANVMAYNPKDGCVYLAVGHGLGRLIERNDGPWKVEIAAGKADHAGFDDGALKDARFTRIDSIVINGRGEIYVLDYNQRIRRIADGQVVTLNASVRSAGLVDGPLEKAAFRMIGLGGNLCGGEDDDTLYLSDHWNFVVRRIDLKNKTVSTVAGMPKPKESQPAKQSAREKRYNRNSDGPALTWASFNSGCAYVCWDPVNKALWCGGPDENRFRWLKDGQILTVIGAKGAEKWPKDALGVPAESVRLVWNAVAAVDSQGRAYLCASSDPHGLWRAYRKSVQGR